MAKCGKRLKEIRNKLEDKAYSLSEAISFLKDNTKCKFDETLEISINLNVDSKKSDQNVRGMVVLPSGSGKTVRVAVFAKGSAADSAIEAGADIVGAEDLAEKVQGGEINFDICIASPDMMGIVGKVAKVLGPKGLMPNPKLGTVTSNVASAINLAKAGQVEYKLDKAGVIHSGLGKLSFSVDSLEKNVKAFIDAIMKAKPSGVKGVYVKYVNLTSTMGVGLKLNLSDVMSA